MNTNSFTWECGATFPLKENEAVPLTCHLAMWLCQRKLTGDERDTSHLLKIKVFVFPGYAWNRRALQISSETPWKRIYCLKSLVTKPRMSCFVSWRRSKLQQERSEIFSRLIRFRRRKLCGLFRAILSTNQKLNQTSCYTFRHSGFPAFKSGCLFHLEDLSYPFSVKGTKVCM